MQKPTVKPDSSPPRLNMKGPKTELHPDFGRLRCSCCGGLPRLSADRAKEGDVQKGELDGDDPLFLQVLASGTRLLAGFSCLL